MSEISKAYEPQSVEDKWYEFWQRHGCFTADPQRVTGKRPAYSIVIPPPNVTGMLHMGHVLNNTIQDILSRKARMDGKEVLWLPGTDHAGIATQVQVERALKKQEKKTKYDLGREEFLKRVWAWKEKHGGIIINQLQKLGCSCDWTRERFTMDPEYSRCVQKVFVELYKKGLIYRGKRMVNWCPVSQTALSDEEVEMKPQKGFMYHFKVEVAEPGAPGSARGSRADSGGSPESASNQFQSGKRVSDEPSDTTREPRALPGAEGKIWLTIATTRPETIPGDTAVAVNPKDPRYAHLIGKHIVRPLPPELPREQKLIPIVGDEHVDFEFGTGVLKVTPAHDKADFEIGQRHHLPIVDIMNPNGTMNDLAGADLSGLDRFEARKVAVEKLKELAALVEEKPYENNVGFSQRADVPIEPRLSEQWFLKYPAVKQSKACVEQSDTPEGRVTRVPSPDAPAEGLAELVPPKLVPPNEGTMRFHPQRWAKVYDHWLANIQDWCISRQLWWGHRIPVWRHSYLKADLRRSPRLGEAFLPVEHVAWLVENTQLRSNLPAHGSELTERQTPAEVVAKYWWRVIAEDEDSIEIEAVTDSDRAAEYLIKQGFTQDPDVLDTWFSSWLWPFATMGWPEQTSTLKAFYPTTDLVTGPDIIFFWVARMIMAGYEFMGDLPFRNVYFTGIIRDKQGRKMSKTLGNSPDPLELIAKYGADALRFGTMRSAPLGQDVLFDEKDVELGRNFCNKLWNACRFRQMVGAGLEVQGEIDPRLLSTHDKWILLKLDQAIREITEALAGYNFSTAVQALYRFFWSEYCDWYVESSKAVLRPVDSTKDESAKSATASTLEPFNASTPTDPRANKVAVIDFILSHTLRLFHPFMPFITEELWHGLGYSEDMPDNQGGKTIMTAPWPKAFEDDFTTHYGLSPGFLALVDAQHELVTEGRNLRRAGNIPSSKKVKYIFKPAEPISDEDLEVLRLLLNAEAVEVNPGYQPPKGTPTVRTELGELCLPLEGHIDVPAEKARLAREIEKYEVEIAKVQQKLANADFVRKVPPQVLQEHQRRLVDWQAKLDHARIALALLG